jgi:hypothetical protein
MRSLNFLIYIILPTALGPGVYSASNRNEYQEQNKNISGELNVQPHRPPRPVMGIAYFLTSLSRN